LVTASSICAQAGPPARLPLSSVANADSADDDGERRPKIAAIVFSDNNDDVDAFAMRD
jgi:hypothetical protein